MNERKKPTMIVVQEVIGWGCGIFMLVVTAWILFGHTTLAAVE